MHTLLTELGVSPELQAYFNIQELSFDYGDQQEVFGPGFHRVPVTEDLWMAGNYAAKELIITSSVMEAVAYMTVNAWRHPEITSLSFIALGLRPYPQQLRWIAGCCLKRKITLVFPNDVCGRITDIVVAAGIRKKSVLANCTKAGVRLLLKNLMIELSLEKVSLNSFEKAASLRTGIRTRKPLHFNTFLDQLHHDNKT